MIKVFLLTTLLSTQASLFALQDVRIISHRDRFSYYVLDRDGELNPNYENKIRNGKDADGKNSSITNIPLEPGQTLCLSRNYHLLVSDRTLCGDDLITLNGDIIEPFYKYTRKDNEESPVITLFPDDTCKEEGTKKSIVEHLSGFFKRKAELNK